MSIICTLQTHGVPSSMVENNLLNNTQKHKIYIVSYYTNILKQYLLPLKTVKCINVQ